MNTLCCPIGSCIYDHTRDTPRTQDRAGRRIQDNPVELERWKLSFLNP